MTNTKSNQHHEILHNLYRLPIKIIRLSMIVVILGTFVLGCKIFGCKKR